MELEQLKHLIALDQYKTLSKAANELHMSQPVLTRSMQKLEEDLEVSLFIRTKNKISLNDNGLMAVDLAKEIITKTDEMKKKLKNYDKSKNTFSIGSCAPAPNIYIGQKVAQIYLEKTILSEIKDIDELVKGLYDHTYSVIIMPYEIEDDHIESIEFMEEQLYFSLPEDHKFKDRQSLSLKEMDGERMLLMSNIGFWHHMHKKMMPHTKFLIQEDRSIFYDLVELSSLASFTSDFMMNLEGKRENRIIVPIRDQEAHATFYCCYLKENENKLKTLLYRL